ncbi:MAG: conjugal transfer protein, partial [Sulfolobus sp.]
IYHKVDGRWRRIALAHFSYDNPFANGLAILLGVIMLFAAIELHVHPYYF